MYLVKEYLEVRDFVGVLNLVRGLCVYYVASSDRERDVGDVDERKENENEERSFFYFYGFSCLNI